MPPRPLLRDLLTVPPVRTVVRLAESRERPAEVCAGFVITDEVARHLHALAEILAHPTGKGVFLRGDFGSGKSHFLAALTACLDGSPAAAELARAHPGLARLAAAGRRFLPVPVSLVDFRATRALEEILVTETERALAARGCRADLTPRGRFLDHLREILRAPALAEAFAAGAGVAPDALAAWLAADPRRAYAAGFRFLAERGLAAPQALVEDKAETLARTLAAVAAAGFAGLVLVVDELSEFLLAKPDAAHRNEDARTLQLLGETAECAPLWIVAAVQESIEAAGDIAAPTLRKIKDRYPVLLRLSTLHIRDLIDRRLVVKKPGADAAIHAVWQDYRAHFPAFACEFDAFRRTYPVHPATLALLEGLGALFSQHRGIVDFVHARLAGDPERAIPSALDRPAHELIAPDALYDHFAARLAEFSDFNVYPRYLVPHLDAAIDAALADPADRALARRLVRILVLYAVHPTAEPPSARALAELAACMLAAHDPDLNAGFVAGALLDPIAERTPHLVKRPGKTADPLDAVFALSVERDLGKTLQARLDRAAAELDPADPRLLDGPLADLPASPSWPAPLADLLPGKATLRRQVSWRGHVRSALIVWGEPSEEAEVRATVERELAAGAADFALVLCDAPIPAPSPHAAVWQVAAPRGAEAEALRDYAAACRVAAALAPGNPADAPLLTPARERVARLEPAAHAAALAAVYAGDFLHRAIPVEPAARQVKRFQRLLEIAGTVLLEERYLRFQEIEPRGVGPSARLYQRLLDELVVPGSLSLSAARTAGLTEAVESLVVPLGLVEVKGGAFRVAPDPGGARPFLAHFFGLLRGPLPLEEVRRALAAGPYGVPAATADFLFVALAHAGLVSLIAGDRRLPLEFLRLDALDRALTIARGELIAKEDRETLLEQCPFLAPAGGFETFGLRQQREAWQAAGKFRERIEALAAEIERDAGNAARAPAFAGLGLDDLVARARRLRDAAAEVKTSLPAREGLERFLRAWRAQAPEPGDAELLERARDFLRDAGEELQFIAYYVRHAAVERAMRDSAHLAHLARGVRGYFEKPREGVLADGGRALKGAFTEFRAAYAEGYRQAHAARAAAAEAPSLSKAARRTADLLRRLAAVDALDRPPGLDALLARLAGAGRTVCREDLEEALLRAPVCGGCGFVPGEGEEPAPAATDDAEAAVEKGLAAYAGILGAPRVLEALRGRAFALADMDGKAAGRLRELAALLDDPARATPAALLDRLDETTVGELARALAGMTRVEKRSLGALARALAGRRLTPAKLLGLVREWLGGAAEETILAVQDDGGAGGAAPAAPGAAAAWWPRLHAGLFADAGRPDEEVALDAQALARTLEEAFPAAKLLPRLARLDVPGLWRFVAGEPLHTAALRAAWLRLAERVLADPRAAAGLEPGSAHVDGAEAAAVRRRLEALRDLAGWERTPIPRRLRGRIALARVLHDPWASDALQQAAEKAMERIAAAAGDWLATLPAMAPLDLARPATVVVLDGVPPDVWLDAEAKLPQSGDPAVASTWQRLEAEPKTVPGLLALFGWPDDRDPAEEFARRGIGYHSLEGNEARPLVDLLPPPPEGTSRVVRLALLDRAGHRGTARLDEMPELLRALLERHLPGMLADARARGHALVLTTDHGQSLTRKGLGHGRGGVFERAVFRVVWPGG